MQSMQSSAAVRVQPGPCQAFTVPRAPVSVSRRSRVVQVAAKKSAEPVNRRDEVGPNKFATQFFGAVAAAQIAFSGAAIAEIPQPVSDVAAAIPGGANDQESFTRPKPGEAKGLPKGPTATPPKLPALPKLPGSDVSKDDVSGAAAGAAKGAVKKSPLGFMQVGDLAFSFPGQANDKDAVTAPKPGEAKGLPKGPTAKPPSGPSLPKLPGSDAGKPDVAGAAKDALKKSPLGFMQVGDVAAAIPGGANDKEAFTAPKLGEAKGIPDSPVAKDIKGPSLPKLPKLPGSDAGKPDVAGAAKDAAKKTPLGFMQVGDVAAAIPGGANDKEAFTAPKLGEAKGIPDSPVAKDIKGPSLPKLPKLPGADAGKPDVAGAAKEAAKKTPLGFMQVGDVAAAIPGGANDKEAFTAPKLGEAKGIPDSPVAKDIKGPSLPKLPKLPGSDAGKPDVAGAAKGAAKDAAKKSPLGFMQVGDLALSFPGQANDKEAFTAPKPGEAKGLPDSPTAKPPSGLGLNLNLPGSNVKKSDLPDGPKFGGDVSLPDVTPTADVPDVPSPEEAKSSLNSVGLPDVSGVQDAVSKAQTAGSAVSGLTNAASKAGDAKDTLQETANKTGLE